RPWTPRCSTGEENDRWPGTMFIAVWPPADEMPAGREQPRRVRHPQPLLELEWREVRMDRSERDAEARAGDERGGELRSVRERRGENVPRPEAAGGQSRDEFFRQVAGVRCRLSGGLEQVDPRDRLKPETERGSQGWHGGRRTEARNIARRSRMRVVRGIC